MIEMYDLTEIKADRCITYRGQQGYPFYDVTYKGAFERAVISTDKAILF